MKKTPNNLPTGANSKKHAVALTKKQYMALMKAVYLGNWIANAHRGDGPANPRLEEFEDTENVILSHAKQFGFEEYVDDELANEGQHFPTRMFDETSGVMDLIDEYDDDTFWDEIVERLAQRDFENRYSLDEIRKMTNEDRANKIYKYINKWAKEINANGLDNLSIKKATE